MGRVRAGAAAGCRPPPPGSPLAVQVPPADPAAAAGRCPHAQAVRRRHPSEHVGGRRSGPSAPPPVRHASGWSRPRSTSGSSSCWPGSPAGRCWPPTRSRSPRRRASRSSPTGPSPSPTTRRCGGCGRRPRSWSPPSLGGVRRRRRAVGHHPAGRAGRPARRWCSPRCPALAVAAAFRVRVYRTVLFEEVRADVASRVPRDAAARPLPAVGGRARLPRARRRSAVTVGRLRAELADGAAGARARDRGGRRRVGRRHRRGGPGRGRRPGARAPRQPREGRGGPHRDARGERSDGRLHRRRPRRTRRCSSSPSSTGSRTAGTWWSAAGATPRRPRSCGPGGCGRWAVG